MRRKRLGPSDTGAMAQDFDAYTHLIHLELRNQNPEDTYGLCFSRLTKPDLFRAIGLGGEEDAVLMIGTDQRDYFVPLLKSENQYLRTGANILDLGCGDGKTSRYLLQDIREDANVTILDPNRNYLDLYKDMVQRDSKVVRVQSVIEASLDAAMSRHSLPQSDLILLIHSIYFASDFDALLNFIIDHLSANGRAFLVFADELNGYTGTMIQTYIERYSLQSGYKGKILQRHESIGISGDSCTKESVEHAMHNRLRRKDFSVDHFERQTSRIFGHDLGDLIASAFITELAAVDTSSIERKVEFVSNQLAVSPGLFDLSLELEGPRKRMISVSQPQFVLALKRAA